MFRIRMFKPGDIKRLKHPRNDGLSRGDVLEAEEFAANSMTYTVSYDDDVVCVGGFFLQWKDCFYAWARVSKDIEGHGFGLTKVCRHIVRSAARMMAVKRVNILVLDGTDNLRWGKLLGFAEEYRMTDAAPDGRDVVGMVYKVGG